MPSRFEHAADIADRLTAAGVAVTVDGEIHTASVHKTRVVRFDDKQLPVCCVYGIGENGPAQGGGWLLTHTLKIDLAFTATDGFDAVSGPMLERVKQILFSDPGWLGRWRELPGFTTQQHGESVGEGHASTVIAYETLVLTCTDVAVTNYAPPDSLAPALEGVDTEIDVATTAYPPGGAAADPQPDGEIDLNLTQDVPAP